MWPSVGSQTEVFASSLLRLAAGHPVGSAFEWFNEKYAEIATVLSQELEDVEFGKRPDDLVLADLWIANNDARNVVILGDPAVRLAAAPVATPVPGAAAAASPSPRQVTVPSPSPPHVAAPTSAAGAAPDTTRAAPEGTTVTASATAADIDDAEVDFGLLDGVRKARHRVADSLNGVARTLQEGLEDILAGMAAIEIVTAVADDLDSSQFDKETGRFTGTGARAVTRVGLAGDVQMTVSSERRPDDPQLWELHTTMVGHATLGSRRDRAHGDRRPHIPRGRPEGGVTDDDPCTGVRAAARGGRHRDVADRRRASGASGAGRAGRRRRRHGELAMRRRLDR